MILRTSSIFMLLGILALCLSGCQRDDDDRNTGYGTMNIQLTANSSVIEVGASSETRAKSDSIRATRAESAAPDVNDFKLDLYKGKVVVTQWGKFSDFAQNEKIAIGEYTLNASYGNIDTEGFDSPYFVGTTSLKIRERENSSAELTCYLGNVKVTVACTETLKKYFKSFAMQLRSDVGTDIAVSKDETRPIYLKPGLLVLNAQLEKQNGTTSKLELLRISKTSARQHYTIKIDVNGGEAGSGALNVTYNSVKSEEDVNIDLSDASLNIKEPVFTAQGFADGNTETLREGAEPDAMKVTLNARARIKTCELTIHAPFLMKELGFADKITVDLASKDESQMAFKQQLVDRGLRLIGLNDNLEKLALVDFTKLVMNLLCTTDADELSTFTLRSTDMGGRVEEKELVLNVLMKSNQFSFPEIEESVMIGSTEANVAIRLMPNDGSVSGQTDVENVAFEYKDEAGQWKQAKTKWDGDDWDDQVLHYAIIKNLPEMHTKLTLRARYGSKVSAERVLNYSIPDFTIKADEVDIWPRKATLKVEAKTEKEQTAVLKYFKLMNGTAEMSNVTQKGNTFLCENLEPGKTYGLVGICNGEKKIDYLLNTEKDAPLPNEGFELNWNNGPYWDTKINTGGPYKKAAILAKPTYYSTTYKVKEPDGWWSSNAKSMPVDAKNQNTWYVVPSVLQTSGYENGIDKGFAVLLRNVAWDVNGEELNVVSLNPWDSDPKKTDLHFPKNFSNRSAGCISLGDSDSGITFTSRPAKLSFYYKYIAYPQKADEGKALIVVENRHGNKVEILASGEVGLPETIGNEYTHVIIPLNDPMQKIYYDRLDLKATHLRVKFTSSNDESKIQTQHDYEKCWSTGSELYIDNVELIY